jgi:hypothetical protein
MKKNIFSFLIAMFLVVGLHGQASAQKAENVPIYGAVFGIVEVPFSAIDNMVHCDGIFDCINLPKSLGKGILNGAERVVGTTFGGWNGAYQRDFGVNGPVAKNKILSNVVGWTATGGIVAGLGSQEWIMGIQNVDNTWATTGAIIGAGVAAVDVGINKGKIDE